MRELNPAQRAAVRCMDKPLLVLAGAGSGKTSVITEKIAHIIETGDLEPSQIAAVTFTNKAAREMRERIAKRLPGRALGGFRISTFHALGLRIVREELNTLGYRPGFSIYDGYDICQLLGDMLNCDAADPRCATVQQQISRAKNGGEAVLAVLPADMRTMITEYDRQMQARNAVDLDDLIVLPTRLLAEDGDVRARWQDRIRYLLVDEYQDTNGRQYELVRLLVGDRGRFTVVGDDDQSIYAWRGAQPENLQQLARDYPNLEVIKLEQNYRSTRRILMAANRLIRNNPHVYEKKLWSELGLGDPIRVLRAADENDEARRVVAQILHHRLMQRCEYRDYAILYRGNHQSRPFEQALREHGVPYIVSGTISFFDYGEIRDALAYMRLLSNPSDDGALLRVINTPRREIGPTTVEKLSSFARGRELGLYEACWEETLHAQLGARTTERLLGFVTRISKWSERAQSEAAVPLVKEMLEEVGYRRWVEAQADNPAEAERRNGNIDDLLAWMARLAGTAEEPRPLSEILGQLSLLEAMSGRDGEEASDCVRLMTLHAAKGLEFPHVHLVGMEEELLPHRSSVEADDVSEERRLAYVGITRARQTLTLSWAASRRRHGETRDTQISRFVSELPQEDLEWLGIPGEARVSADQGRQMLASLKDLLR